MSKHSDAEVETMARELMRHFDLLAAEFLVPQESSNVSRTEVAVLRLLADQGPSNMSDVSAGAGVALSSATGVVDRLVERKLVERERPESDRRTVQVRLTARGRRALHDFQTDRVRLGLAMLQRLEPGERDTLLSLFRRMTTPAGA